MSKNIQTGDIVFINHDISKSYRCYGKSEGGAMDRMTGKRFKVDSAKGNTIKIYCEETDFYYAFHADDLHLAMGEDRPIPPPEQFDIDNLFL